ncbi:hypothetical protein [Pedobacter sp.]
MNKKRIADSTEHQAKMNAIRAQIIYLKEEERRLRDKVLVLKTLHWFQLQSFRQLGVKIFAMQRHIFHKLSNKT